MVEVPQVRVLVAEGVDQGGVLEQLPRARVAQADADAAIVVADPVAAAHLRPLGLQRPQGQAIGVCQSARVRAQPL